MGQRHEVRRRGPRRNPAGRRPGYPILSSLKGRTHSYSGPPPHPCLWVVPPHLPGTVTGQDLEKGPRRPHRPVPRRGRTDRPFRPTVFDGSRGPTRRRPEVEECGRVHPRKRLGAHVRDHTPARRWSEVRADETPGRGREVPSWSPVSIKDLED